MKEKEFPWYRHPLVHCLTNDISSESVANALLFVGAKPLMAEDLRELPSYIPRADSVLLNIARLSPDREASLKMAAQLAQKAAKPVVLDVVGIASSPLRLVLARELMTLVTPYVVKGNISEMRALCDLRSQARGVDGAAVDQDPSALRELKTALKNLAEDYPSTVFLATGAKDLLVCDQQCALLENGIPELDQFTGTGDMVGALIAASLTDRACIFRACVRMVSYFNICAQVAQKEAKLKGLASIRIGVMDQLSLLYRSPSWWRKIKGEQDGGEDIRTLFGDSV